MAEDKTGTSYKTAEPAMVRASDLLALKRKHEKLQGEYAQLKSENSRLTSEVKVAKANVDDEGEASEVRKYLQDLAKETDEKLAKVEERETSLNEREKEVRVQALASEHGVDAELIKAADDPEKEALRLKAERLTKEKEEATKSSPAERVFEFGIGGGKITKPFKNMDAKEFATAEQQMKADYNAKH